MIIAAKILLCIASVFAALSLICAVMIGRRAPAQSLHFGVASRPTKRANSAPADPYSEPFGDMPGTGFTTEQLRAIAPPVMTRDPLRRSFIKPSGRALGPDAGSGRRFFPSGLAAARNYLFPRKAPR